MARLARRRRPEVCAPLLARLVLGLGLGLGLGFGLALRLGSGFGLRLGFGFGFGFGLELTLAVGANPLELTRALRASAAPGRYREIQGDTGRYRGDTARLGRAGDGASYGVEVGHHLARLEQRLRVRGLGLGA